jgi:hypothetical protein
MDFACLRSGGALTTCLSNVSNFRYPGGLLGLVLLSWAPLPVRSLSCITRLLRGQNAPRQALTTNGVLGIL